MIIYEMQPFGTFRDNWHFAQLTAVLANINRGAKTRPFKVADFMYKTPPTKAEIEARREADTRRFMQCLSLRADNAIKNT